jgi:hypothetical protein
MDKNGLIQAVLQGCLAEKPGKWLRLATLGRPHDVGAAARVLAAGDLVELRRVGAGRQIRLTREGRERVQADAAAVDRLVTEILLAQPTNEDTMLSGSRGLAPACDTPKKVRGKKEVRHEKVDDAG